MGVPFKGRSKTSTTKGYEATGGPSMKEHSGPDVAPNNPSYGNKNVKNSTGPAATYYEGYGPSRGPGKGGIL